MKKIVVAFGIYFSFFVNFVFAKPHLAPYGLPSKGSSGNVGESFFVSFIDQFIGIILVLAVFALIFSGIYYLISAGNEEKSGKAKKWIIWSLIGVFLATLSWGIVNFLNNINISL